MNNNAENIFAYIKEIWSCVDYARIALDLPIFKEGDRCKSFRADASNPTSLLVYNDCWFDFGAGTHGDVIDLCAIAKYGGDKGAAIRELAGDKFSDFYSGYDWLQKADELEQKINRWQAALRPEDIEYLHSRAITDDTISRLRMGFDPVQNRLVIPYWKNGRAVYYASRDRSGAPGAHKYKKAFKDGYVENVPWGLHTLMPDFAKLHDKFTQASDGTKIFFADWLVIAEGMFDVISFEQEGFHCLSPISGYFNKSQTASFIAAAKNHKNVFILFDSDKAGISFQNNLAKTCFQNRIKFFSGYLPQNIKDASDYYAAGGNLADLIVSARDGLATLAENLSDEKDFSDFLYKAARFVGKADIWKLCSFAASIFDKNWLKALYQDCTGRVRENLIVDDVLKTHQLKYIVASGFYEYARGVWLSRPDEFIKRYVKISLGNLATNARMCSIANHIKTQCASEENFNTKNFFNFLNGTLDLDNLELHDFSASDMLSIQVNYEFNKNSRAPLWDKFIGQVMEDNQQKILLLQEIAGYVFFPDCSLEKCFMLLGSGANGKSVFINTLRNVFGPDNCSNVSISDLVSNFEPIHLRYSIANFVTEMRSSLKGTSERFKNAISGEPLTAAYKGKDSITFISRAKWISASNSFIASNDVTRGTTRRLYFVNFGRSFSDQEADKDLSKKLLAELPGIFNWCLDGYKRLRQTKSFTLTDEMKTLEKEFRESINPLEVFVDEELVNIVGDERTSTSLYTSYSEWAKKAGFFPVNRIRFTREIRRLLAEVRPDVKYRKSGDTTSFIFGVPDIMKG